MRFSEFVRNISEVDVALGLIVLITCSEEGCEGKRETCDNREDIERAQKLLVKLRELGLLGELEGAVGRQVTADDLCAIWGFTRLYTNCVNLMFASEGKCREAIRHILEDVKIKVEDARKQKKRLEGLLKRLGSTDSFWFKHKFFGSTLVTYPLADCGMILELNYSSSSKFFEISYYTVDPKPLVRDVDTWFTEIIDGALDGSGLDKHRATFFDTEDRFRLWDLDPDTAFRLFETFAGLTPALNEACLMLPMRYRAGKTGVRVRA